MPGESFDASSEPHEVGRPEERTGPRRFVGVRFECCRVYCRIYINREQTAYVGNCPRCGRQVRLRIGPEGTDARFFTAY